MLMNLRYALMPALLLGLAAQAQEPRIEVTEFDYYGPFAVPLPLMVDSVDVNSRPFDPASLLSQPVESRATRPSGVRHASALAPGHDSAPALHMLAFSVENTSFATPTLTVEGLDNYKVTVDGVESQSSLSLKPATHRVVIKYLSEPGKTDSVRVAIEGAEGIALRADGKRLYGLDDVLHGERIAGTSVSPGGKYMITSYTVTSRGGAVSRRWAVRSIADGRTLTVSTEPLRWMPSTDRYYVTRKEVDGRSLVAVDPATGNETVLTSRVPDGYFSVLPSESALLVVSTQEGPKEDPAVYRILEPEDRQPGWRNRSVLSVYDLASGVLRPVTHGYRGLSLLDVADDSRHALVGVRESRLEKRPTTLTTILSIDLETMKADTIVAGDGFVGAAIYSPDASSVLVSGSPEAFGGIGRNLPADRIPSMVDNQLFLCSPDGSSVKPLTRNFDPSVAAFEWSRADGKVYFTAENRDCISFYQLDPRTGHIVMIPAGEDLVKGFSMPRSGTAAVWFGQSAANPDRLYTLNTRTLRSAMIEEPQKDMLADVDFGTVDGWSFVNSRGDSIHGRFYLPPGFDPSKKYPLIVNYYGGCSPTSRNFESRYPHHAYAAQGYVVYVIEPSGATGFGQEFSSRHVATAGQGVADDIIEGTKRFCEEHPYVDASKIGCIGASYGGFMTQYLQTVTDIFAAAISHAGISDHTSYWGEGYWGYSYSEVSMGDKYPWSDTELYVKQSPLYNAHKIHTPLLFLHGDKDNNVPVGESIQMFTALKLLGRETAFVAVADQDHHILDYDKRIKWQDTIYAWFAKYLKDDPTWWDKLYPTVAL